MRDGVAAGRRVDLDPLADDVHVQRVEDRDESREVQGLEVFPPNARRQPGRSGRHEQVIGVMQLGGHRLEG